MNNEITIHTQNSIGNRNDVAPSQQYLSSYQGNSPYHQQQQQQPQPQQRPSQQYHDSIESERKGSNQKMKILDRIHTFDYLTWAAMVAIFTSIWQIAIPFSWVETGPQKWLGIVSIFLLMFSVLILAWAKHNHSKHKEWYAKSLLHHQITNGSMWNVDKLKSEANNEVEIVGFTFAQFIFVISLLLVIVFSGLFLGNNMFQGYFISLESAKENGIVNGEESRKAKVLLLAQTLSTILNIANLLYYAYQITPLCLTPQHYPPFLTYFLTTHALNSILLFFFHLYLLAYVKANNRISNSLQHQGCIDFIGILASIAGFISFIFMIFNFFNTRNKKPNQKRYLHLAAFYFLLSGIIFAQSLILYMDVKNAQVNFSGNCNESMRDYSEDFLQNIGCPRKYFVSEYKDSLVFDMNCNEEHIGLVWERDISKNNNHKMNQRSCINIACCPLIEEFQAVQFWTFLILASTLVANSLIVFTLCLMIYTQNDRQSIRSGKKILSAGRMTGLVALVLLFLTISILSYIYSDLQGITDPPKRSSISTFAVNFDNGSRHSNNSTKPSLKNGDIIHGYLNDTHEKIHLFNTSKKEVSLQSSLEGCQNVLKYLEGGKVDLKDSFHKIQKNKSPFEQNSIFNGYEVCLNGEKGVFWLSADYQDPYVRIQNYQVWNPYRILQAHDKSIVFHDQFCFQAETHSANNLINHHLHFCLQSQTNDSDIQELGGLVKLESVQKIQLKFPSSSGPVSLRFENLNYSGQFDQQLEDNRKINKTFKKSSFSHQHHNNTAVEIEPQDNTPYQPGDEHWLNVQIEVYAAEDAQMLHQSEVLVYPELTKCKYSHFDTSFPIRRQLTDLQGTTLIQNLPANYTYAIHYRHDDYLFNCIIFDPVHNGGGGITSLIRAPLVRKFIKGNENSFKIMLSWTSPLLSLRLSGTFNAGQFNQCQVGFYQQKCGGMEQFGSPEGSAQVIVVEHLGKADYLFYVEHMLENKILRNLMDLTEGDNISPEDEMHLKFLNQLFFKSNAIIKVYVPGSVLPISEYALPNNSVQELKKRHPVWLALCFNGKLDPYQYVPLGKYWQRSKDSKNALESQEKSQQYESVLPNADICEKFDLEKHNQQNRKNK